MKKSCLTCKKEFYCKPSHYKRRKFCSRSCRKVPTDKRKQISKSVKIAWKNPILRRKMCLAMLGRPSPRKGVKMTEEHKKKISEANKGKPTWNKGKTGIYSDESIKKMSQSRIGKYCGENSSSWKGGISTENERIRHSLEYKLWDDSVKNRDCNCCQNCGETRISKLTAHHILNFSKYIELRLAIDNGITFCRDCHKEFHKQYGRKNNTREQLKVFINL